MLVNFLAKNKSISFFGCATQMFLFVTFGTTECFLLAAMAYDRYVAIYNPLLYSVSMSPRVYVPLLLLFYFVGSIEIVTILIVLISYGFILLAILKMHSAEGRKKVFSTCGSHLTGVSIYHGTILFMYVRPSSSYALDHDMIVSIFYTIVIPMLNPIIYSLRNKDVKEAVKKLSERNWFKTKVHFKN
ncbi:Olfactory receptor 5T1 [Sciurus carolinensis]|uniref:Olfactory receptor 5T1 n=1 Tax=Sciurus carolinensis TaxID=30640 RepID=A0AA41MBQ0_SCICA|nr:Olfactory receptor 5T1 [Sciurus carolinensis]